MLIQDDKARGVVAINGYEIPGWVDDRTCARCGARRVYHMGRDAFFCPACNTWLEEACGDTSCSFCSGRPARPLPARPAA
jgi:hypothetical protein